MLLWVYALTVTGIHFNVFMDGQFDSIINVYSEHNAISHVMSKSQGDGPSIQSGVSLRCVGVLDHPCCLDNSERIVFCANCWTVELSSTG